MLSYMRARSLAAIVAAMPRNSRLLELGCGTGTEAVAVSRELGSTVIASDPSRGMLDQAGRKAERERAQVRFRLGGASETLRGLSAEGATFDGAWASFSLSYDEPLSALRHPLAAVMRTGAPFICTLRNTFCLAEPWSMVSRVTDGYRHRVGSGSVPLRHTSPRAAARALAPEFRLDRAEALPALLPTPAVRRVWPFTMSWPALERLDERVAGSWPLRHLGDHTLMRFRRARTEGAS